MRILASVEHSAHATVSLAPAGTPVAGTPSAPVVVGAVELLKAIAFPARLTIVLELAREDLCVHDLVDLTGLSQPLVSQHLRVLRAAHIVTPRRRGREAVYSLTDEHLAHIAADAIRHAEENHR
jgi:DNA-binding transcriptional ArsR family regulator